MPSNVTGKKPPELLSLYADIMSELIRQEIIRSTNNPAGDYSEFLCIKAFGWSFAPKSSKGHDAIGQDGTRYEIKSRRLTKSNRTRRLSGIRDIDNRHFDFLVGVVFEEDFSILKGCLIPFDIVRDHSKFQEHTKAWIFILNDDVWELPKVRDITKELQNAESALA